MKKTVVVLITLCLVQTASMNATAREKGSWYIGFGLGSGIGWLDTDDYGRNTFRESFDKIGDRNGFDFSDPAPAFTGLFGVGAIISPIFHLGGEVSGITQQVSDKGYIVTLRVLSAYVTGTYYPVEKGLLFKLGAGYNRFSEEVIGGGDIRDNGTSGYGGLVGIGYDISFGSSFNLGLHADYTMQQYNRKGINNLSFLNIYVSFYWF